MESDTAFLLELLGLDCSMLYILEEEYMSHESGVDTGNDGWMCPWVQLRRLYTIVVAVTGMRFEGCYNHCEAHNFVD